MSGGGSSSDAYALALKTSLVHELFVRTADENYITARWCAINQLNTDFLWLGLHCLEKYLKAVLLMNGRSSEKFAHNIVRLYTDVEALAGPLLPDRLEQPAQLDIATWFDQTSREFIQHLQRNGNANNRYLLYGYRTFSQDLHMLDTMVFAIRRLIGRLDDPIAPRDQLPNAPTLREMLIEHRTFRRGMFMPLDNAIDGRGSTELRTAALNLNMPFAPADFEHTSITSGHSSLHPAIIRHVLDPLQSDDGHYAAIGVEVAKWLLANVTLPRDIKSEIEGAIAASLSKHSHSP